MRRSGFTAAALAALAAAFAASPATAAVESFVDIFTEISVTAPPYPTDAIITVVGTNFGGSFQATQECRIAIADMSQDGIPDVVCRGGGGGGGAGGSAPAIDSFFDVFVEIDLPSSSWNRSIKDIRIVHPPGTPPGTWKLVPINPGAPPGSVDSFFDVFVTDSFFDITYRVLDDTGHHTYHMHGTSPSGRASFFDVFVELESPVPDAQGMVDSFFDIFVDSYMVGPRNPASPDCRLTTTGQYETGPVPVSEGTWGGIKALYAR